MNAKKYAAGKGRSSGLACWRRGLVCPARGALRCSQVNETPGRWGSRFFARCSSSAVDGVCRAALVVLEFPLLLVGLEHLREVDLVTHLLLRVTRSLGAG